MFNYYLKMASKAFLRFRLHSFINLASLIIGFGCFITASVLSSYFTSFDMHFPHSDKIYVVSRSVAGENGTIISGIPITPRPLATYLRTEFPELDYVALATAQNLPFSVKADGKTRQRRIRFVEPDYLHIFPVSLLAGNLSGTGLEPDTAIISEAAAREQFGTTDVVGRHILIGNKVEVTIAGVMAKFNRPSHIESAIAGFSAELIVPIEIFERISPLAYQQEAGMENWRATLYTTFIRFAPGSVVDVPAFEHRLGLLTDRVVPNTGNDNFEITWSIAPVNQMLPAMLNALTGGTSIILLLIFGGFLVLLVAGLNYSNLVIAQLIQRSQEIGVQKIMGARRRQLVTQYSLESVLLTGAASLFALIVAALVLYAINSAGVVTLNAGLLITPSILFSVTVVLGIMVIIAGTFPALRITRLGLLSILRSQGTVKGYSHRLRSLMVGIQFVVSSTLLILVIVMFHQNQEMVKHAKDVTADQKVVIPNLLQTADVDPEVLASELTRYPGIHAATRALIVPWSWAISTMNLSRTPDKNARQFGISYNSVSYDFFDTLEISFIAGRNFSRDRINDVFPRESEISTAGGPYSIIIDEATVSKMGWDNPADALGQTVYQHIRSALAPDGLVVPQVIIGVVANKPLRLVSYGATESVYLLQPYAANNLILRVDKNNIDSAVAHIDSVWETFLPGTPLNREFLDDLFQQTAAIFLLVSYTITALALFAFSVSSIGLLGIASFVTSLRQREVGIRKVMGASSWRVLRMLLLDFSRPVIIANLLAWPLGFIIARVYVSIFTYQTTITILPFLISFAVAVSIAWLTVGNQALKSSRVRPAAVLKYE